MGFLGAATLSVVTGAREAARERGHRVGPASSTLADGQPQRLLTMVLGLRPPGSLLAGRCPAAGVPPGGCMHYSIGWCAIAVGSRPASSQAMAAAAIGIPMSSTSKLVTGTLPSAEIPPLSELSRSQPTTAA